MKYDSSKLFCFSPPVMIATFIIELSLVIITLVRYKMSVLVRLVTVILSLLALFQLSEFNVCGASSNTTFTWSRIGYVAITLLPPLSIHLIHILAKVKSRLLVWVGYSTGITFAAIFGLSSKAFVSHICGGNYAIFQLTNPLGGYYFVYYYGWLFVGIILALYLSINSAKNIRQALILQVFGYLSFLLPTGIVNTLNPQTISGIPSIMCGFAVMYALILSFGILPTIQKRN